MAGRKLSAKTEEEVVFMEQLLAECVGLLRKVEEYSGAKKNADAIVQAIIRHLQQVRQRAMIKNLGPLADAAGALSVQAGRGSQVQRTRVMREGIAGFRVNIERTIKAAIDADARARAEAERAAGKPEGAH